MKNISRILLMVFAVGVLFSLFAGVVAFLCYVAALIVGGETGTALCMFVYDEYFPVVIRVCSISVGFGLAGMYINKIKALSFEMEDKKE